MTEIVVSMYAAKGKTRWVILDLDIPRPRTALADGWASDKAAASAAAVASLRVLGITNWSAERAYWARGHDRETRRVASAKKQPGASEQTAATQEWLYTRYFYDSYADGMRWNKVPITKKTAKRVYFLDGNHFPDVVDGIDVTSQCFVSRQELEVAGQAWHQTSREVYFTEAAYQKQIAPEAVYHHGGLPCLVALGIKGRATVEQVKSAFKRLAVDAHPDRGGSDAAFIQLMNHYKSALQYAKSHAQESVMRT